MGRRRRRDRPRGGLAGGPADRRRSPHRHERRFQAAHHRRQGSARLYPRDDAAAHSLDQSGGAPVHATQSRITHYAVVEISVDKMRRVLGRDVEFAYACGVADEPLACVVGALVLEAQTGGASGPLFADSLGVAVAARLAQRFGQTPRIPSRRGALESRLKMVLESSRTRSHSRRPSTSSPPSPASLPLTSPASSNDARTGLRTRS